MAETSYVRFQTPDDLRTKALQLVEVSSETGKIRKGTNEVTKVVERGEAKIVVIAEDIQPPEVVLHIPLLCEEKGIPYFYVQKKEDLGQKVKLKSSATVAIIEPGNGKQLLTELTDKFKEIKK
ncbi:MAG: 50S ribosomal protein L7Ae [Thermoplasmatales archaeon]|jgi:large subunit ribosomal protein L7Ae|nr:50S ribosomal protein L7Ae [Candidatus Thermoplasmatota archaeon]MCL6002872.1 50S ribosomal protein L7Ae [Candidatus Thermoplasmatota archaeon]MDA8056288.1 50S ribosomal protein L7Ae [Thermoplasmatales archaeon]